MQQLPNFLVLDFCEWLRRAVLNRQQYKDVNIWDLLFDPKYDHIVKKKAKEYCVQKGHLKDEDIKMFLESLVRMYYRSEEFQDFCYEVRKSRKRDGSWRYNFFERLQRSIRHFSYHLSDQLPGMLKQVNNNFRMVSMDDYRLLIDNACYLLQQYCREEENDPNILELMIMGRPIEIDFLEWIEHEKTNDESIIKIDLMPLDVFEKYVLMFCEETGKDKADARKLIKSFKQSDPGSLIHKLNRLLPYNDVYRKKNLRYVSQRYLSEKIPFKCVILPLEADDEKYHELITYRWKDLNDLSSDYLDIYYCYANYGQSGYDLMQQLSCLPNKFHAKLPCILLWDDDLENAYPVDISQFNPEEIYYLIRQIVDLIIEEKPFDEIVKGVNNMSEEKRHKEHPFIKVEQHANGASNVQQIGVVDGDHVSITGKFLIENSREFIREAQEALKLITENDELNAAQKENLASIITEAQEGVQQNSTDKVQNSKERFKTFMVFVGNTATKLISSLAGLSTIAKFFGIVDNFH